MARKFKFKDGSNSEIRKFLAYYWENELKKSFKIAYGSKKNFINTKVLELGINK